MMETTPALPKIALPGQPLGPLSAYVPGPGTHLVPSHQIHVPTSSILHASILGPTITTPTAKGPSISISRQQSITHQPQTSLLPKEGNIILGRITRINIREARVQILVIGDIPVMEDFVGVIRYLSTFPLTTASKMSAQQKKTELKYTLVFVLVIL